MSEQKDISVILDEWEALANAATKGPWRHVAGIAIDAVYSEDNTRIADGYGVDMALIASARISNPLLIKALRTLLAEVQPYGVNKKQLEGRTTAILNGEK